MSEQEIFESKIKNTVGYNEADNKKSFIDGAMVAHNLLKQEHEEKIGYYQHSYKAFSDERDKYLNDLKTLANLITKYSD